MPVQDRRSGEERRRATRYRVDVDVEWENDSGRFSGTMSDVSANGCFVLSSGEVGDGERVRIFVPIGDGMKVQFDGTIANHVYEIGFGVRFDTLSQAQQDMLATLIQKADQ